MFQTIGRKSRRQQVIDKIAPVPVGEVVKYEELEDMLNMDRLKMQAVVNAAKTGLQKEHQKSIVAVPTVGYRVLLPEEHIQLAKRHQKKGRRQTRRSKSAVVNTDYAQLSEIDRVKYDIAVATLRALETFEHRADLRYASRERVESFINQQASKNERTDDEVQSVKQRLAKLESLLREQNK